MKTNTSESRQRLHADLPFLTFCIFVDYVDRFTRLYKQLAAKPTRIILLMSTSAKAADPGQPLPCVAQSGEHCQASIHHVLSK